MTGNPHQVPPDDELPDQERARVHRRDRKRAPRMVVDNQSLKRTQLALAQKRASALQAEGSSSN